MKFLLLFIKVVPSKSFNVYLASQMILKKTPFYTKKVLKAIVGRATNSMTDQLIET